LVLAPGSAQQADTAEAQEKQLIEVFKMFVTGDSTSLGSKELQSLHLFLRKAADRQEGEGALCPAACVCVAIS
jgi:hypothetical protein